MHDHQCQYCLNKFICPEDAYECFRRYIVCDACWWQHNFKQMMLVGLLAVIALCATIYLFREMKKPAFAAPVSSEFTTNTASTGKKIL